jgi:hypothetical protein
VTLAFDVAVGQRATADRVEGAHLCLLDEVAVLVQLEEQVLGDAVVVGRRRTREHVVRHPQPAQVLDDHRVVVVDESAWRDALLVSLVGDRSAVLVRAAGHEHPRAAQALKTREHIRGYGKARDMADVARAIGVRPGRRDQNCSPRVLH